MSYAWCMPKPRLVSYFMGFTRDENRVRRVALDARFADLSHPDTGARITRALSALQDAVNSDRTISSLPNPTGLSATGSQTSIALTWDALDVSYKGSWDGARIWRANAADDSNLDFLLNAKKEILVTLIRATGYLDEVGDTTATYIYWIEWINIDGVASGPSGGVSAAATGVVVASDAAAPGQLVALTVTGAGGTFKASWKDPLTYIATLDMFAQQYSTTSSYTTAGGNECVTWGFGKIYAHEGFAPNKTYYFRYAAHNQSGDTTSNTDSRLLAIKPDGWGAWTSPASNPVSSSSLRAGSSVDIPDDAIYADLICSFTGTRQTNKNIMDLSVSNKITFYNDGGFETFILDMNSESNVTKLIASDYRSPIFGRADLQLEVESDLKAIKFKVGENLKGRIDDDGWKIGEGDAISKYMSILTPWNPGELGNLDIASGTFTVTGCVVGDLVCVSHNSIGAKNVLMHGFCQEANVVRVVLHNISQSTMSLTSGGYVRIGVIQHG